VIESCLGRRSFAEQLMLRVVVVQAPALFRQSLSDFVNMSVHDVWPPPVNSAVCMNPPKATALPENFSASLNRSQALFIQKERWIY
jgi:hypothetical protein